MRHRAKIYFAILKRAGRTLKSYTEKKLHKNESKTERRILSDYLNFVPKRKGLLLFFLLQFLKFCPKTQMFSRKKGLLLESPLIYRFPPQIFFSKSRKTHLRNLHYNQKTGNRRWAAPNLK